MQFSKFLNAHIIVISLLLSLFSCVEDDSATPTMNFNVDGTSVKCKTNEFVFCEQNIKQNSLFIAGEDLYGKNLKSGDNSYELYFDIKNIASPKDLVGIEILSENEVANTTNNLYVYGSYAFHYFTSEIQSHYYQFETFKVKVTKVNDNKVSGVFSGTVKSIFDQSISTITNGTFKDIPIEKVSK